LSPSERAVSRRLWETAVIVALGVFAVWSVRAILPIVVAALFYAVLTWPLVEWAARKIPRGAAIASINAAVALIGLGVAAALAPLAYAQLQAAATAVPAVADKLQSAVAASQDPRAIWLTSHLDSLVATVTERALQYALDLARSAAVLAASAAIVPFLAAYLQADASRYRPLARSLRLPSFLPIVTAYIRGQLIVSAIVGILVTVVLSLAGVRYALLIGIGTAAFDLVPYLGGIVAFVPSLFFAVADGGIMRGVLVAVLLIVVFEIEAQLLAPQIVGARIGLPPSVVVIALLVGGTLLGVVGLYLAVPTAAVVRVFLLEHGVTGNSQPLHAGKAN
jgi:predicted PurR-regulated permease PerM